MANPGPYISASILRLTGSFPWNIKSAILFELLIRSLKPTLLFAALILAEKKLISYLELRSKVQPDS
jgi:hypothetical protein